MQVDRQLAALLDVLLASPDGKTMAEIAARLNEALSRRTLNRRLAELERRGQVARRGKGRRVRYYPIRNVQQPPQGQVVDRPEWISKVGLEIQTHVCQPLSGRRPVGYQRSLLADYQPNQTRYLGSRLSAHLSELGSPISPERPSGTFARDILGRILIDLSWASSRLEGNTYSRLDTQRLVEFGQVAEGKDAVETQMILNHKAAIELLVEGIEEVGFNAYTFLNLHALLSENLLADPLASGRLRQRPVEIAASPYVPTAVPQLIEECFQEILRKAAQVADPFEQAFFLLVHIPYLQPFEDVNKRVSRLGANIPFIKNNLSPLSFVDVPENLYVESVLGVYELARYELLRDLFVWAYERSCQRYVVIRDSVAEPDIFRMRYREALIEVVGEVVRKNLAAAGPAVRELAAPLVEPTHLEHFVKMVSTDLRHLHEGNIARYRLRPSDFRRWKKRASAAQK